MDDLVLWATIRRALLMVVKAIEKRYPAPGDKMTADEVEEPPKQPRYLSSH